MGHEAGKHVVRVLPDGFGDDQRGVRRNGAQRFDAALLRVEKAVALHGVVRMSAGDVRAREPISVHPVAYDSSATYA